LALKHRCSCLIFLSVLVSCPKGKSAELTPQAAGHPPAMKNRLAICTYNVLADPVALPRRLGPLMTLLSQTNADIIALQEVAPWFLAVLRDEVWAGDYQWTTIDGGTAAPGGQFILSKLPVDNFVFKVLPGRQMRTVLIAHIRDGDRDLAVATAHMESYLEDGPTRAKQLDVIFGLLAPADEAIFLGDLNFGDGEEPETSHLPPQYRDLWAELHRGNPGFTWNIEESGMAKAGSFPGEPSRRLDRVLYRSKHWRPTEIRVIGNEPLTADRRLFPSDHFGLVGVLERVLRPQAPLSQ